ncbi:MAG: hypothetical protein A3J35_02480 [Gammaproteobacteria bacterium RIFCSPLOWO2_02_FULL_52_10]|nr:MAG: hypothetical protein A3J35_02480 [Gammaproteobacteria bacterium RIFCSPLOWO2_02_FULL_52_10]
MTIWLIVLLVILTACWYEILKIRELVMKRCQQVCAEAQLQFLDQTVAVIAVKIRVSDDIRLMLYRTYQFEYSENGVDRYKGYVDLLNHGIVSIRLTGDKGETIYYH